ncbi:Predicted periplasmic lipoprotein [Providencia rustigianii]|nr:MULTISPECIES: YceK/YidQ family lipoprotein [Providencia]MTC56360.1 YceK/YidQ family lipoprotein [Providencia rustigianii]MTC59468.1 YceK/YidQ family lipoprotein [Providencia rustigianii]SPY76209.1 Predicted periplasmic lipoprotein [Providencia rustigianii]SUC25382.1 Predicted periplasmic lipoprotein [Providencia rustigianii]VEB63241.1 Predicted periplasmic lipoprotein [Providencia rustigianii]
MPSLIFFRSLVLTTSLTVTLSGCSSIMTHAGPTDSYYPGTKNSVDMLQNEDTGWVVKPLLVIDLPFTALMDTLLIPLDYIKSDGNQASDSPKKRVEQLDKQQKSINK